jgi:hypothetical protein
MKDILLILWIFCGDGLFAQTDSLKYYSKIFKDTSSICDGSRKQAYRYIIHHPKINVHNTKWIYKYLGYGHIEKDMNEDIVFSYPLECSCLDKEASSFGEYLVIRTHRKTILRMDIFYTNS